MHKNSLYSIIVSKASYKEILGKKMKIVGLITEYNPFHNGHRYHIEKALEMTDSDAAIVLMSGNFVQRGTPALLPKHIRAKAALLGGASVVLELPVLCACGSAEYFARGAVSIFNNLGCVDCLCFGSECNDPGKLEAIAGILAEEPEAFRLSLQNHLKQGDPFPLARQRALGEYTGDTALAQVLEQPNNILGIEYIKAIYQTQSSIRACAIQRQESEYHDTTLSQTYSSASAIRHILSGPNPSYGQPQTKLSFSDVPVDSACENVWSKLQIPEPLFPLADQVPQSAFRLLCENYKKRYPIDADDFSLLLKYRLLTETAESLNLYADMTWELANRINRNRNKLISWSQFCNLLKTREVTFSRISRILLHILLGITKDDTAHFHEHGYAHYARILGFSKSQTLVLKEMKANSRIPLITKPADRPELNCFGERMLNLDIFAANLYESVVTEKYKYPFIHEYEQQICII